MQITRVCALIVPILLLATLSAQAQSGSGGLVTTAGVHAIALGGPAGTVRVYVSSDAAPGDSIAGVVVAEPSGVTPQEREVNLRRLGGFVLEFQTQRTPVSNGRYQWSIPNALRTGSGQLLLRDPDGQILLRSTIPIDPVPVPLPRAVAQTDFEVPTEGETGKTAVIRGRSDRELTDHTVTLGGTNAELLAKSPRQIVFRVPATTVGPSPLRFTAGERVINRTLRALHVRLVSSSAQLFRGQRADLSATVSGLSGISEPVMLTIVNHSSASVRIDGINRPITISPGQVTPGGTFAVNRRITGIQAGPFQISASVGKPPLSQFDAVRSTASIMDTWQARTGVAISAEASDLVQRSVLGTRGELDEFLSQQQANQGDVREVFAAILSHYCFDLRDAGIARSRAEFRPSFGIVVRPVLFQQGSQGQGSQGDAGITASLVQRLSLSDMVSRLTSRFTARQAAGYLFVRSMPRQAPISIDGQRGSELTDRRLIAPVGEHDIVIRTSQTCRQRVTVTAFRTEVVECVQ